MKKIIALLVIVLMVEGLVWAQTKPASSPTPPPVPRERWLLLMLEHLPRYLCQDGGAWITCYGLPGTECQTIVTKPAQECLEGVAPKLPENMTPSDGGKWGKEISKCFVTKFEDEHKGTKKDIPECKQLPPHLR